MLVAIIIFAYVTARCAIKCKHSGKTNLYGRCSTCFTVDEQIKDTCGLCGRLTYEYIIFNIFDVCFILLYYDLCYYILSAGENV